MTRHSSLMSMVNGQVYTVSFDIYGSGWTITGANLVLDDIEQSC